MWLQNSELLTTGYGRPVGMKTAIQTVGRRGPALLQDVVFLDELAHFDRERIPERVVHAKGAGKISLTKQQMILCLSMNIYIVDYLVVIMKEFV